MRGLAGFAVLVLLVNISQLAIGVPTVLGGNGRKALIMSSLDKLVPFGYYGGLVTDSLKSLGYAVTTLNDGRITLDFITTSLNNYDIILWRTNSFTWNHQTYWYVGEPTNQKTQTKYSEDFKVGRANAQAGIIGVSITFFSYHYSHQLLKNVKLAILISSNSVTIASVLLTSAGVQSSIYCLDPISLTYGIIDDFTYQTVAYLKMGQSVSTAISNVHAPFVNPQLQDPLDTIYEPPLWFGGDPNLTIT